MATRSSCSRSFGVLAFLLIAMALGNPRTATAQTTGREAIQVDGRSVRADVDPESGLVRQLVNAGRADIRLGGRFEHLKEGDEQIVEAAARQFLARNAHLLRIPNSQLGAATIVRNDGKWSVSFRQEFRGVPVVAARIGLSVDREGRIISFGTGLAQREINLSTTPTIDGRTAVTIVLDEAEARREIPGVEPELSILPELFRRDGGDALVWQVILDTSGRGSTGATMFMVDAMSGEIVLERSLGLPSSSAPTSSANELLGLPQEPSGPLYPPGLDAAPTATAASISGQVTYNSFFEPGFPLGQPPLLDARVIVNAETRYTNQSGNYSFPNLEENVAYTVNFRLETPAFRALNDDFQPIQSNSPPSIPPTTANLHWPNSHPNTTGSNRANIIGLATEMREYFQSYPFNFTLLNNQQIDVTSGAGTASHNGAANPELGRLTAGNLAAMSSDVIFHEYTHLVIAKLAGGHFLSYPYDCLREAFEACAMDEGFPDFFMAAKKNDLIFGDHVLPAEPSLWRHLDNSLTMDSLDVTPNVDLHRNGQIISGTVWDLKSSQSFWYNSGQPADYDQYIDHLAYLAFLLAPTPRTFKEYAYRFIDAADAGGAGDRYDDIVEVFCNRGIFCPPKPAASSDVTSGDPPLTVSFSSSGSVDRNAGGTIVSYSWDFGDGSAASGASPSHTYTAPGTYVVTLTAVDNDNLIGEAYLNVVVGSGCGGSGSYQVNVINGTISRVGDNGYSDPAVGSTCWKFPNQWTRVYITADSPSAFDHWVSPSGHINLIDGHYGTSTTTVETSFNTNGQSPTFEAINDGGGGGGGSCGGSGSYQVDVINGTISRVGDTGYSHAAVGATCWKFPDQWTRVYITADNASDFDHWESPSGNIGLIDGHNGTSTTTVETSFNTNGQSPTFEAIDSGGGGGGGGSCYGSGQYKVTVQDGYISGLGNPKYTNHGAVGESCFMHNTSYERVWFKPDNPATFVQWSSTTGHTPSEGTTWTDEEISVQTNSAALTNMVVQSSAAAAELTAVSKRKEIPSAFILEQNYPNPFNPITRIRFGLPQSDHVQVVVYNVLGEKVDILNDGPRDAGWHEIVFDASDLPSGAYYYTMRGRSFIVTKMMTVLK